MICIWVQSYKIIHMLCAWNLKIFCVSLQHGTGIFL